MNEYAKETQDQDLMAAARNMDREQDILNTLKAYQEQGSILESELLADPDWVYSSKVLFEFNEGKPFEGDDQAAASYGLNEMTSFNSTFFNVDTRWSETDSQGMAEMMFKLNDAGDHQKVAFAYLHEMFDMKDWTIQGVGRTAQKMTQDPLNLVGLGLPIVFVARYFGRQAAKEAVKYKVRQWAGNIVNTRAGLTGLGAVEGAAFFSADDAMRHDVNNQVANAVGRDEQDRDLMQKLQTAGSGALFGGMLVNAPMILSRIADNLNPGTLFSGIDPTAIAKGMFDSAKEFVGAVPKTGWDQVSDSRILQEAKRIKRSYMRKDNWAAIEPVKGGVDKDGKTAVEFKKIPYDFHKPRGNISKEGWAKKLTSRMVSDIDALVSRAVAGDENAQSIIAQATWYRDMRTRLRSEFGGLGDVFADVIGATSAQTNVTQNWDNAIQIMRRFSRGDYDQEVNAYLARLESGEGVNPTELTRLHNSGEFSLITKAAGELFNTNSPAATGALVGIFRDIKAGRSPKTPNFTGNLIGYTNEATVDVWAARYLRNAAGLPYIPPPAEKAVGGKHLVGSTIDEPRTGAEFGFGQKVFSAAADQINESGVIREFDESLGNLGPDDLQAVVWFLEKEKWTERGWTNRAGEGGSLDLEASYAGSQNPERIKELRSILNSKEGESLPPEQRQMMEAELAELAAPLERTVLGLSGERPGQVPTNQQQAEMAQQLDSVVRDDQSVVAYKTTNTYGRFMGDDERAIDAEFVTREDFDPTELTQAVIRLGKEKDQDSVFISRVVTADHANARPGVEVYFTHSGGPDRAAELSDKLTEYGIDGFTYITDARQADRIEVQAGTGEETAAIVGLRVQYIPEFEFDNWAQMSTAEKTKILETRETDYQKIAADLIDEGDVSQVNAVYYDTDVIKRGEYDARLKGPNSPRRKEVRQGSQTGADAEIPAANAGNQRTGNVSDRQRAEGDA